LADTVVLVVELGRALAVGIETDQNSVRIRIVPAGCSQTAGYARSIMTARAT